MGSLGEELEDLVKNWKTVEDSRRIGRLWKIVEELEDGERV